MKDLKDITLGELQRFEEVRHDGKLKDMDDFLDWAWERDLAFYKYEAKSKEGSEVLEVW